MATLHDSEDFLEKSSRTNNKKNKNRSKPRLAEDELRGMQKKINFKRYLNDLIDQTDEIDDDFEE